MDEIAHIIAVGGIKGGVGKTTIATNLAIDLSNEGHRVLLVDADEQGSSTTFTRFRKDTDEIETKYVTMQLRDSSIKTELPEFAKAYDYVILDVGGRDTSSLRNTMVIADILLLPFPPRSLDVWTAPTVQELVENAQVYNEGLKALAFLNKADPSGTMNEDTIELLETVERLTYIDTPVGDRKAFAHATNAFKSVLEMNSDQKAVNEVKALYKRISEELQG